MPMHYSGGDKKMDKKTSVKKQPAKGSKEMKDKMKRLRAMKGKK